MGSDLIVISLVTISFSHFQSVTGPPLVMLQLRVTFSPSVAITCPELGTTSGFTEKICQFELETVCSYHLFQQHA